MSRSVIYVFFILGKSTLLAKLLEDNEVFDRVFTKLVYCAPLLSDREQYVRQIRSAAEANQKQLLVQEEVPKLEEIRTFADGEPVLLCIDDVNGYEDTSVLHNLVCVHSHHDQVTTLLGLQCLFIKSTSAKKVTSTALTRNASGFFLMNQRGDIQQYRTLNSRICPERPGFFMEALDTAQAKYQLPYIFVNTASFSSLQRRFMVYTGVFQQERAQHGSSPIFFDLQAK